MATKPNNIKTTSKAKSVPVTDKLELSPSTPMPFEGGRGFSFNASSEYLPFLSSDDNYGKLLLEARLLSNTHNACVVTKKDYCAGSGFQHKDNSDLKPSFVDWVGSMNLKDEPNTEINKQIFESHFTFGNTPIELVRFSAGGKKRLYVYVHNFLEWRLGMPDDNDIVQEAVQSKLFLKDQVMFTEKDYKVARKLPLYNARKTEKQNWKTINGAERTLLWYKNSVTGFNHYGLPSAVSGLIYEILEYKGARYNLDNLDNNMVVSAILALKGNLSQTEANRIGKRIISNHTGDGKRGRVAVVASEEGIDGSDIHNLDTHKEGSYTDVDNIWTQKIILANQWDAVLAGILSASTLGKGSGFLTKILEIKQNTVIKPAQFDLLQKVWIPIFKIANSWFGDMKIDQENIVIKNAIDISGLTDVDITPAVTVDEVREAKGLPASEDKKKGKMFLGELGADQKKGVYVKQSGGGSDPAPDPNNP